MKEKLYFLTRVFSRLLLTKEGDTLESYGWCFRNVWEIRLYKSQCDLVTIQTAKVHEYEASLLQKLDEVATQFYSVDDWTQTKKDMKSSVDMLLAEAHG